MTSTHAALKLEPLTVTPELLVLKIKNTEDELIRLGFLGSEAYVQLYRMYHTIGTRVTDTDHHILMASRHGEDATANTTANTYLTRTVISAVKSLGKPYSDTVRTFAGEII